MHCKWRRNTMRTVLGKLWVDICNDRDRANSSVDFLVFHAYRLHKKKVQRQNFVDNYNNIHKCRGCCIVLFHGEKEEIK